MAEITVEVGEGPEYDDRQQFVEFIDQHLHLLHQRGVPVIRRKDSQRPYYQYKHLYLQNTCW